MKINIRPHPGPLPQERENRSAVFCEANAPGGRSVLETNELVAAIANRADEFSNPAALLSLSPGERAGVRAGANTNFLIVNQRS